MGRVWSGDNVRCVRTADPTGLMLLTTPELPTSSSINQVMKIMTRSIPGTLHAEGREFLYVETAAGEDFHHFVDEALTSCESVQMPQSGGVIEEKTQVALDDGKLLLAISYKGDTHGWRRKLTAYCESQGRKWGLASDNKITLSDGSVIDLLKCDVTFVD